MTLLSVHKQKFMSKQHIPRKGHDMADLPEEKIRIIEFGEEDAEEISQLFREVWPLATAAHSAEVRKPAPQTPASSGALSSLM